MKISKIGNSGYLTDESGRVLMLRGVNLGGSTKVPSKPDGATWRKENFFDHRNVSFVGRPFPLEEADKHFSRLKAWGYTFLRFLVTWEAVEHAGPGIFDRDYLAYVRGIIGKAAEYGISVFIDPHQDVWSRFSGGDGAPGWVFEAVGLDITGFNATGAAITHQEHGDPFPRMIWPTNYSKLASATMFTLFFAGNSFAPKTKVDSLPVQDFLQNHYIASMCEIARALDGLDNVAGYGTMNEPSAGYIGTRSLNDRAPALMLLGDSPTVLQSFQLGQGVAQRVDVYGIGLDGIRKRGTRTVDPNGRKAWLPGRSDVWMDNGVWPHGNNDAYFSTVNGTSVDFYRDFFRPFANKYAREIRKTAPGALIFVEGIPTGEEELDWQETDEKGIVYAGHWYDSLTLVTKDFRSWLSADRRTGKLLLGGKKIAAAFAEQIGELTRNSRIRMNGAPSLVGEVGIPFDLRGKRAYRTGDFSLQTKALDATMKALEANLANFTLWNYTSDNTNVRGDNWNDEDLSLWSADQVSKSGDGTDKRFYGGGRALKAALRPYPMKTAGIPVLLTFDIQTKRFEYRFENFQQAGSPANGMPTEIFIPELHYPHGFAVECSDGTTLFDEATQMLSWTVTEKKGEHFIRLSPRKA